MALSYIQEFKKHNLQDRIVKYTQEDDSTLLHVACKFNLGDVLKALIDLKMNVNHKDHVLYQP